MSLCCILTLFILFNSEIISPHCVSIVSKQKKISSVLASRGLPSFVILQATFNNFIELFFFQTSLHTLSNFNKIAIQTLPQAEKEKQLRIHWRQDYSLRQVNKVCPIENNTNLSSIFCLIKSSKIDFIFLPAFYLIMQLMVSPKNFEKIAVLKK